MYPSVLLFLPLTHEGLVDTERPPIFDLDAVPAGSPVRVVYASLNPDTDSVHTLYQTTITSRWQGKPEDDWRLQVLNIPPDIMVTLFSPHAKSVLLRQLRWYSFQTNVRNDIATSMVRCPVQDWNEPAVLSLEERRGCTLRRMSQSVPRILNNISTDVFVSPEQATHIWLRVCALLLGNTVP